ncbi:MAG: GntR family transcriptional regulator [Clostridia bacterium]|nr:GntR family transcriptional regulator [Clostridia bacterium]
MTQVRLSRDSLVSRVYRSLREQIVEGKLAPGSPLVEAKISEELGVSRTPVREALRLLEQDGLVETVPNKCTVVVGIDAQDISDTYDFRTPAFGLCARWATLRMTDEEILELKNHLELQEFYLQKGDFAKVDENDSRFHDMLYDGCRSRAVTQTMRNLHDLSRRAREIAPRTEARIAESVREHRDIFEAIADRDPDAAQTAAEAHLINAKEHVLSTL